MKDRRVRYSDGDMEDLSLEDLKRLKNAYLSWKNTKIKK